MLHRISLHPLFLHHHHYGLLILRFVTCFVQHHHHETVISASFPSPSPSPTHSLRWFLLSLSLWLELHLRIILIIIFIPSKATSCQRKESTHQEIITSWNSWESSTHSLSVWLKLSQSEFSITNLTDLGNGKQTQQNENKKKRWREMNRK